VADVMLIPRAGGLQLVYAHDPGEVLGPIRPSQRPPVMLVPRGSGLGPKGRPGGMRPGLDAHETSMCASDELGRRLAEFFLHDLERRR